VGTVLEEHIHTRHCPDSFSLQEGGAGVDSDYVYIQTGDFIPSSIPPNKPFPCVAAEQGSQAVSQAGCAVEKLGDIDGKPILSIHLSPYLPIPRSASTPPIFRRRPS